MKLTHAGVASIDPSELHLVLQRKNIPLRSDPDSQNTSYQP